MKKILILVFFTPILAFSSSYKMKLYEELQFCIGGYEALSSHYEGTAKKTKNKDLIYTYKKLNIKIEELRLEEEILDEELTDYCFDNDCIIELVDSLAFDWLDGFDHITNILLLENESKIDYELNKLYSKCIKFM